jgi:hypothetical protein
MKTGATKRSRFHYLPIPIIFELTVHPVLENGFDLLVRILPAG